MNVYVFGSLNMDLVGSIKKFPEQEETTMGNDYFITPGGKGFNQAFTASKLGAKTFMIGAVGDDAYGHALIDNLVHGALKSHMCKQATIIPQDLQRSFYWTVKTASWFSPVQTMRMRSSG